MSRDQVKVSPAAIRALRRLDPKVRPRIPGARRWLRIIYSYVSDHRLGTSEASTLPAFRVTPPAQKATGLGQTPVLSGAPAVRHGDRLNQNNVIPFDAPLWL